MSQTQKHSFPPIKTPRRLNAADMIESDFVSNSGSTVTILHVVLLCSKRLGPLWGVQLVWTVLIMLLVMAVATVSRLMPNPASSPHFQFKVQAKSFLVHFTFVRSLQTDAINQAGFTEFSALKYRGNVFYFPLGLNSLRQFWFGRKYLFNI